MKILITGSSGMIGTALSIYLSSKGHDIVRLTRSKSDPEENKYNWIPEAGIIDTSGLEGINAVVHLAGENISSGRWTDEKKARIRRSRVKGTKFLCESLARLNNKPEVVICASAIGYYGERGDEILTEDSGNGEGFLAEVCSEWENAIGFCSSSGVRTSCLRTGLVLSMDGGALPRMLAPFKMGAGGTLGSGKQYMSWIALDDLLSVIEFVLLDKNISGPVNAAAPNPVTNREFTKTLGSVLKRPALFSMPSFAARLIFGEMGDQLLLSSTRVIPEKLRQNGFRFRFEKIEAAIRSLLNKENKKPESKKVIEAPESSLQEVEGI